MTETPQQEALRLAKEAGFVIEDDNDTAPAFHACTTAELVCLIALARASQAQPEPPAGWVMVPKELTVEMLRAVLPGEGTYSAAWWGELLRKSWKAMLAAAPSPKGEGMNIEQLADMLEKIVTMKVATHAGYQSRANECKKFVIKILKAAGVVVKP